MMKRLFIACLCASFLPFMAPASGQIVFVSHNESDVMPEQCVLDAGIPEAPDKPYTDLLSQFVNVDRYLTGSDLADPANLETLNNAALVIISRAVSSGAYQDPPETAFWNTQVTSPVMVMSGYIVRDSRLNYFDGGTIPDTTGAEKLEAVQPDHPVFAGISLDGSNVMTENYTDGLVDFEQPDPAGVQRGISIVTNDVVGGEVIGRISADGSVAGGTVIAEWDQGATLNNGETLAGRRMLFLSGSREAAGLCVPGAAGFDLTAAGEQMFLNAVDYMYPGGILGVPGDVDGNELVNDADFDIISGNFGQSPAAREEGDLNRNSEVDLLDFRTWKQNVPAFASASAANVPEPASIGLVLLGGALLGFRRFKSRQAG